MRIKLLVMSATLLLSGCLVIEERNEEMKKFSKEKKCVYDDGSYEFDRIVIEGHDYLIGGEVKYGHESTIHSKSCRKCKQERDSIVNLIIKTIKENDN